MMGNTSMGRPLVLASPGATVIEHVSRQRFTIVYCLVLS